MMKRRALRTAYFQINSKPLAKASSEFDSLQDLQPPDLAPHAPDLTENPAHADSGNGGAFKERKCGNHPAGAHVHIAI